MTEQLHFNFSLSCIGEGNGNPLLYSCLENPRDGQAQWAAVLWGHTESDMTEATQQQQQHADDTTLMAESEEELKNLLMKVKEESRKVDLKLNIQKTKIMPSGPITSCKQMGKQWKQ